MVTVFILTTYCDVYTAIIPIAIPRLIASYFAKMPNQCMHGLAHDHAIIFYKSFRVI